MAVLWCGGEDIDFTNGLQVLPSTNNNYFRPGYARCALSSEKNAPQGFAKSSTFQGGAASGDIWLSFRLCLTFSGNNSTQNTLVGVGSNATGKGIFMGYTGTGYNYSISISTFDGSNISVLAQTSTTIIFSGALTRFDLHIKYASAGSVTLYINGAQQLTYSGNVLFSGVTGLDTVFFGGGNPVYTYHFLSEVFVANESTIGWPGLVTLFPTNNGSVQEWQNSPYTNFNPITINDGNATYATAPGQDEQAAIASITGSGVSIKMVKVIARVAAPVGSATTNIELGFANASGTIGVGPAILATTGFTGLETYFANDPTTGSAWANMTNYELNLRSA